MTRKWDPAIGQFRDSGKFGGNDGAAAVGGLNALQTAVRNQDDDWTTMDDGTQWRVNQVAIVAKRNGGELHLLSKTPQARAEAQAMLHDVGFEKLFAGGRKAPLSEGGVRHLNFNIDREAIGMRGRFGSDVWERYLSAPDRARRKFLTSRGIAPLLAPSVDRQMQTLLAKEGGFNLPVTTEKNTTAAQAIATTWLEDQQRSVSRGGDNPLRHFVEQENEHLIEQMSTDTEAGEDHYYAFIDGRQQELVEDLKRMSNGIVTPLDIARLRKLDNHMTGAQAKALHDSEQTVPQS